MNEDTTTIFKAVCHELREIGLQAAEKDNEDFEGVAARRPRAFAHITPRHLHQFLAGKDRRRFPRAKHFLSPLGTYSGKKKKDIKNGNNDNGNDNGNDNSNDNGNNNNDNNGDNYEIMVDHATLAHIDALVSFSRKRVLEKYHRDILPETLTKLRGYGIKDEVSYFECENLLLRSTPGIRLA